MRLRRRRYAGVFVLAAFGVAVWPGPGAGAVEPDAVGYWVQAQSNQVPSPLPNEPLPSSDPVVPKGGMYVANSADGPKAISAVVYSVDGVVSAVLELRVHSYTPPPPGEVPHSPQNPPSATPATVNIAACPADPWVPPANGKPGAWENRPRYSGDCVLGQFSGDGSRVSFELRPDQQASEGVFNMAIVPAAVVVAPNVSTQPVNKPFSITFDPPREESLSPGEPDTGFPDDGEDPSFDVIDTTGDSGGNFGVLTPPTATGPVYVVPTTPPAPRAPAVPRVNLPPRVAQPAVAPGDERGERIMAVSLLMALAVAWWWFGGQQSRGPVLLGSLGGEGRRPRRVGEPTGGVGRFARPRTTKPRKLV